MVRFFFDSSALVKRYVDEEGTQGVLDVLSRAEHVIVSRLTGVEIASTLVRRARRVRFDPSSLMPSSPGRSSSEPPIWRAPRACLLRMRFN